jgi:hypothetical protein
VFCLLLTGGCTARSPSQNPHRKGPKVNIAHLIRNPGAYKGKTITLGLMVDEGIAPGKIKSLRQHANQDVKFTAKNAAGESFLLVIWVPDTISIPEAATGDEVVVTFVCSRGDLRQGNEARAIEKR